MKRNIDVTQKFLPFCPEALFILLLNGFIQVIGTIFFAGGIIGMTIFFYKSYIDKATFPFFETWYGLPGLFVVFGLTTISVLILFGLIISGIVHLVELFF